MGSGRGCPQSLYDTNLSLARGQTARNKPEFPIPSSIQYCYSSRPLKIMQAATAGPGKARAQRTMFDFAPRLPANAPLAQRLGQQPVRVDPEVAAAQEARAEAEKSTMDAAILSAAEGSAIAAVEKQLEPDAPQLGRPAAPDAEPAPALLNVLRVAVGAVAAAQVAPRVRIIGGPVTATDRPVYGLLFKLWLCVVVQYSGGDCVGGLPWVFCRLSARFGQLACRPSPIR